MSFVVPELAAPVEAFATALGIGLLVGLERERRPDSAAGLRTFALVAMLGCLFALLGEKSGGPWLLVAGLLVISGSMIASNFSAQQEEQYRGFTSEAAIIVTYGLGAAVWFGYATLAVMLAITTTVLLYFKAELRQFSERTTPKDINSILQFAVLSLVILPILPSADFGPYNAINPRQVWWMVVLISGLALSGYLALRIIGARHGAALLGIFGGLASSTATTMMFSRHARDHVHLVRMSAIVILIANVMVMIRLGLVSGVVAPNLVMPIATVFACGIVPGVVMALYGWKILNAAGDLPMPEVKNPTELRTAISFGLLYAVVLLASAWLQDIAGNSGLYIVALASGLTDADASVLSTLRMFNLEKISSGEAVIAVTLALMANLIFKIGLVISIGGAKLARYALPGLVAIGCGMAGGLLLI
ncbi:MgtC/SapB family protein [Quatrionicoccus australiensis]|uniref:MgtC/SapB family protein n=1 Tax=Quatrionicoccus australiensis TaxID=138118 RepID=UPI001CF982B3|nr:MgtC/SapB family protein [Quatrionicoccus australiensis]MCB4361680.1 MgtC/SapB family protein [Quatrionicoccus australiensis]